MSAAAIGLLGVIVGAGLTGVVEYIFRRRAEALEARVAARLVSDAFLTVSFSLHDPQLPEIYNFEAAVTEWQEHRAVLARALTNKEWDWVCEAGKRLAAISGSRRGTLIPDPPNTSGEAWTSKEWERAVLDLLGRELGQAIECLHRLAAGRLEARRIRRERDWLESEPDPVKD